MWMDWSEGQQDNEAYVLDQSDTNNTPHNRSHRRYKSRQLHLHKLFRHLQRKQKSPWKKIEKIDNDTLAIFFGGEVWIKLYSNIDF